MDSTTWSTQYGAPLAKQASLFYPSLNGFSALQKSNPKEIRMAINNIPSVDEL